MTFRKPIVYCEQLSRSAEVIHVLNLS